MALKRYKPMTPGTRYKTVLDFSNIDGNEPQKSLVKKLNYKAGRSNGRIAVRRKGGQNKRKYRLIDFKRNKTGVPGTVAAIQYDPNRSANIALIKYSDGEYRYILAPDGMVKGQAVMAAPEAPIKAGNSLPLRKIPPGTSIHNIEMQPGRGGQVARSAGNFATVAGHDGKQALLKMPSGELRKFHQDCQATVGIVGNRDHNLVSIGKAGRSRWVGKRPKVRGVVMNPVDHPHGGGEGKSSGGRHPVSPTGVPTKGYKTRKKRKSSDGVIVQRRKNKRIGR